MFIFYSLSMLKNSLLIFILNVGIESFKSANDILLRPLSSTALWSFLFITFFFNFNFSLYDRYCSIHFYQCDSDVGCWGSAAFWRTKVQSTSNYWIDLHHLCHNSTNHGPSQATSRNKVFIFEIFFYLSFCNKIFKL